MTLVAVLAPVGVAPRHRAAPSLAFALSAVRALGAEVKGVAIWRHSPELALACGEPPNNHTHCRRGVVEWLDGIEPAEASEKIVRYLVEYDAVGALMWGFSPDLRVSAVVYAPGVASYLGLPPIDVLVHIKADVGGTSIESFYDLFLDAYERYAEFIKRLDLELTRPVEVELRGKRARVTPYVFLERVDAAKSLKQLQNPRCTVPVFRREPSASIICDIMHKERMFAHFDSIIAYVREKAAKAVSQSFKRVGGLMLPKSADAYDACIAKIKREIEDIVRGPRRTCGGVLW